MYYFAQIKEEIEERREKYPWLSGMKGEVYSTN